MEKQSIILLEQRAAELGLDITSGLAHKRRDSCPPT